MIRRLPAAIGVLVREPGRAAEPWPRRPVGPDPSPTELAAVQAAAPAWLVMWCWYRREYAALARFGAKPTIIYDRDPRQLLRRCQEAELAASHGRHRAHRMPVDLRIPAGDRSVHTSYGRSPP